MTGAGELDKARRRLAAGEPLSAAQAAVLIGVHHKTLLRWVYKGKAVSSLTPGGHHRLDAAEVSRLILGEPIVRELQPCNYTVREHGVNDFSRLLNYAKQRYGDEPATLSMAAAANAGGWETYLLTPRQRRRYLHKRNREARRVTGAIRAGRA